MEPHRWEVHDESATHVVELKRAGPLALLGGAFTCDGLDYKLPGGLSSKPRMTTFQIASRAATLTTRAIKASSRGQLRRSLRGGIRGLPAAIVSRVLAGGAPAEAMEFGAAATYLLWFEYELTTFVPVHKPGPCSNWLRSQRKRRVGQAHG